MSSEGRRHPKYFAIWGGLLALTILELGVAYMDVEPHVRIIALVFLACWKALLVALYFMHLRFEPKMLSLVAVAPLLPAVIMVTVVLFEYR